jgi:hypothetical protein
VSGRIRSFDAQDIFIEMDGIGVYFRLNDIFGQAELKRLQSTQQASGEDAGATVTATRTRLGKIFGLEYENLEFTVEAMGESKQVDGSEGSGRTTAHYTNPISIAEMHAF